jgi:hypothetical protein
MSIPPAWPQVLDFFGTPIVIEPSPGRFSSDAGLLPICQFDERVGLTRAFADALDDPRDPHLTEHTFPEMVRARVFGILAGYEDPNDHDTPRTDPGLQAPRRPPDRSARPDNGRRRWCRSSPGGVSGLMTTHSTHPDASTGSGRIRCRKQSRRIPQGRRQVRATRLSTKCRRRAAAGAAPAGARGRDGAPGGPPRVADGFPPVPTRWEPRKRLPDKRFGSYSGPGSQFPRPTLVPRRRPHTPRRVCVSNRRTQGGLRGGNLGTGRVHAPKRQETPRKTASPPAAGGSHGSHQSHVRAPRR